MKVKVYDINTTDGMRYGLKSASTGDILPSGCARWKTERGAVNYARKLGWEVVR